MRQADVVVVGGSAAGLTAAITSRRHYPDRRVLIIRREREVLIPCGIPYIFGTVGSPRRNLIADAVLEQNGIDLLLADATGLDREGRTVNTGEGPVRYGRLVLATGSRPVMLPVPGCDLEGVCTVVKDVAYLEKLQRQVEGSKDIVVIGGGFIGVEFADEINKLGGKRVSIVEVAAHCLSLAYDEEFCTAMEQVIASRGIRVHNSSKVERVEGAGRVQRVVLSGGTTIDADLVLLAVGSAANVDVAKAAPLRIGLSGGIAVDRTMQTSDKAVFACGDCAEKISFFGGRPSPL